MNSLPGTHRLSSADPEEFIPSGSFHVEHLGGVQAASDACSHAPEVRVGLHVRRLGLYAGAVTVSRRSRSARVCRGVGFSFSTTTERDGSVPRRPSPVDDFCDAGCVVP